MTSSVYLWLAFEPPHDKTNKLACAPSKDSDQPGHPPSLSGVFALRMKKARFLSYQLSAQRRLIRLGGCPGWSESSLGAQSFCWFCQEAAHLTDDVSCIALRVMSLPLRWLGGGGCMFSWFWHLIASLISVPKPWRSSWHHTWRCHNIFSPSPVFRYTQGVSKPHICQLFDVAFSSLLLSSSPSYSFHGPLQNYLRYARITWDVAIQFEFPFFRHGEEICSCILDPVANLLIRLIVFGENTRRLRQLLIAMSRTYVYQQWNT